MVTQAEVRRAIWWGDKFLRNCFQYVEHNGKTYGIIKSYPTGFPLTVFMHTTPKFEPSNYWYCYQTLGLPFRYTLLGVPEWAVTWMWLTEPTISASGKSFVWEAKVQFGFDHQVLHRGWVPVADFYICYMVDPDDDKRMKATIRLEAYHRTDWTSDAYFYNPNTRKAEPIITDLMNNVGREITVRSNPYEGFPSLIYWPEETFDGALYFQNMHLQRSWVHPYMKDFLTDFGYTLTQRSSMYLLAQDTLPDTEQNPPHFLCRWESYHTCDVWETLPHNPGGFPFFSRNCEVLGRFYAIDMGTCLADPGRTGALYARALHLLNKYKDPQKKENIEGYQNSAEDYILNGFWGYDFWTGWGQRDPLIKGVEEMLDKLDAGPPVECVPINLHRHALQVLSILGYGFGYERAQNAADRLADYIVKMQWGYPFNSEEEGYGYTSEYGKIWRPDLTGGFRWGLDCISASGTALFQSAPCPQQRSILAHLVDFLFGTQPQEFSPPIFQIWLEVTIPYVQGLRVYEAYKWRTP